MVSLSLRKLSLAENTFITSKYDSPWQSLMRDFCQKNKEKCDVEPMDECHGPYRQEKELSSGAHYDGEWNIMGMHGYGEYTYENGVVYEGQFENGMMHGKGELRYQLKGGGMAVIRGRWKEDVVVERALFFAHDLEYKEEGWNYCKLPDRRFAVEFDKGMKPAGRSYLTAYQPTKEIPPGLYDTGDGFFDPKAKVIFKYDNLADILRAPSLRERQWIVVNCRRGSEEPLGPRPDLYEKIVDPVVHPKQYLTPGAALRAKISAILNRDFVFDEIDYESAPCFYDPEKTYDEDKPAPGESTPAFYDPENPHDEDKPAPRVSF
ncbi:MORN repeat-containing protein 5-like [Spodoptera frugiperda]|uniref:MORN repeat-containing protein 5 n=1 Tax=Spodoptera frugiperda TaxID=7108 RepID=A0A9R0EDL2_SPOFR|nr:MORN repeat-containing protein 5-like [Spodoptera frugiperda]